MVFIHNNYTINGMPLAIVCAKIKVELIEFYKILLFKSKIPAKAGIFINIF